MKIGRHVADKRLLLDGAAMLYRRQSKDGHAHPTWQMRIKLPRQTGYIVRSCKTKVYEQAYALATETFFDLQQRAKQGVPLKDWSFAQHWEDWYERQARQGVWSEKRKGWHRGYFKRYFSAYFGSKLLNEITAEFADGYWPWRISYWQSAGGQKLLAYNPKRRTAKTRTTANAKMVPASKTLAMERTALNQIFADAARLRRLPFPLTLRSGNASRIDTRRPTFSEKEWEFFTDHMEDWARGVNAKLNSYLKLRRRQCYVWFLATTGLRVGEARVMRWEDVFEVADKGQRYLVIRVRVNTKKGMSRDVVSMPITRTYIELWRRWKEHPKPQDLIWQGTDLNKTFQSLLRSIPYEDRPFGLLCDADGKRRSLYSLRHFYATQRLLHGDLDYMKLAANMGASVAHLENHYSHVTTIQNAASLTSDRRPLEERIVAKVPGKVAEITDLDYMLKLFEGTPDEKPRWAQGIVSLSDIRIRDEPDRIL
jgi:integrase